MLLRWRGWSRRRGERRSGCKGLRCKPALCGCGNQRRSASVHLYVHIVEVSWVWLTEGLWVWVPLRGGRTEYRERHRHAARRRRRGRGRGRLLCGRARAGEAGGLGGEGVAQLAWRTGRGLRALWRASAPPEQDGRTRAGAAAGPVLVVRGGGGGHPSPRIRAPEFDLCARTSSYTARCAASRSGARTSTSATCPSRERVGAGRASLHRVARCR